LREEDEVRPASELEDPDLVLDGHGSHAEITPEGRCPWHVLHPPDDMTHPERGAIGLLRRLPHGVLRSATARAVAQRARGSPRRQSMFKDIFWGSVSMRRRGGEDAVPARAPRRHPGANHPERPGAFQSAWLRLSVDRRGDGPRRADAGRLLQLLPRQE